ncbi:flavoprotein-like protein [Pilobolus umbonatus]|nr:flavoprotein-like protein [Pilobolus umbonatus]
MPTVYIIIYSLYHHIYKVAKSVQKGLESQGVTVKIYQVAETLKDDVLEKLHAPAKPDVPVITVDDLTHADGFLFGIPTRFGTLPAQFKTFLDATGGLWASNALAGKFVGTFFSTASQNGGQDTTAFTLIPYFTHLGMMYVSLGAGHINLFDNSEVVGGSPFGAGTVANGDGSREPTEKELAIAVTQGENYAKIITTYHRGLERQETENKLKNDSPVVSNTQPITEERSMQQEQDPVTAQQESSSEVPVQVVEVPAQAVEAPAQAVEAPAQAVEVPAQEITDTVHPTEHVVRPAETSPIQDISTTDEIRPSDEFQPAKVEKLPSEVTSQPPIAEEPVQEKPAVKAGEKKDRKLEKKEKKHKKCFCM